MLFFHGASNNEENEDGILLKSSEEEEMTYALRFNFKATNNKAKYEALTKGLRIAQRMQAREIDVLSDSQVRIWQVQGSYKA